MTNKPVGGSQLLSRFEVNPEQRCAPVSPCGPVDTACESSEDVLGWLTNVAADTGGRHIQSVPLTSLATHTSPRSGGLDHAHVRRLTEAEWPLPPILVHRVTMQVVDGHHRVAAAAQKGHHGIAALLLDVSVESLFLIAVSANIQHGLPLSLSDRRIAASTILRTHPEWSDRGVAAATGLSAKTVRALRCASDDDQQLHTRIGRDGRYRPIDTTAARRQAAELIAQRPDASLREIASMTGISPGTVRDVRARLTRGEDPVPGRPAALPRQPRAGDVPAGGTQPRSIGSAAPPTDASAVLSTLARDPALRMNSERRELLRWLHSRAVDADDGAKIVAVAPDHCLERLYDYANRCSVNWALIAEALSRRMDAAMAAPTEDDDAWASPA